MRAHSEQRAMVVAVHGVSSEEKKEHGRQELHQASESEVQRTMRNFVDLPADRDGLHFGTKDNAKAGDLVKAESGELEGGRAGGESLVSTGHE